MNHDDQEIEQESALAYPPRPETDGSDAPQRFQAIMAEAKGQLERMLPPDAEVRLSYRPREGNLEPEIVCRMDLRTPDASGQRLRVGPEKWTAAWKNRRPRQPRPFKIELGKPVDFQVYS